MDFKYFFRRNFGGGDGQNMDPDDESEDIYGDKRREDSFDHFANPFGSSESEIHDMFQHMEGMFNRLFSSFLGPIEALPDFEEIPNEQSPRDIMLKKPSQFLEALPDFEESPNERNPRDIMLKKPDDKCQLPSCVTPYEEQETSALGDSDIDDKVAKQGLFLPKEYGGKLQPRSFSYKKFSSVRTIRLPDGTTEEHRTFTDGAGKKITTIRRCIGDQCHEIITHSDGRNLKEKEENYINIDEAELPEFEKKWRSTRNGNEYVPTVPSTSEHILSSPSGDPTYLSLFKKFFFK